MRRGEGERGWVKREGGDRDKRDTRRYLVHGLHPRAVVLAWVALQVDAEWDGADRRVEVVEAMRPRDPEPVRKVLGVGEGGREGDEADRALSLGVRGE